MKRNYQRTTISCFVGIFVQAIITNITAVLFIPLMDLYDLSYAHLGFLVGLNFCSQVCADISFSGAIDKLGYRKIVLPTTVAAFLGLILFAVSPILFAPNIFVGLCIATFIFAFSSGLLEIILSPIIAAIPDNEQTGPAMSLMHSFYAWGQVAAIIVTTLLLFVLGKEYWQLIVLLWAIVPAINFFMFLGAPLPAVIEAKERMPKKRLLFAPFYLLSLLAIFLGGASEVVMNQWSSTFLENGLGLPKIVGDLVGMTGFVLMLGLGRLAYAIWGKNLNMSNFIIWCSLMASVCYVAVALAPGNVISVVACILCGFAVSQMWPGIIVIVSDHFPLGGAWMFAILAAAGDIGAGFGPWLTGVIIDRVQQNGVVATLADILQITSEQAAIRFGLLVAALFPVLTMVVHIVLKRLQRKSS